MRLDYTPGDALQLILTRLDERSPGLAERARVAIDAGKDDIAIQEVSTGRGKGRRSTRRPYRKNRPMTDREAIDAILEVLTAHVVCHRMVVNSVVDTFTAAALGDEQRPRFPTNKAEPSISVDESSVDAHKAIEIELQPEAARAATGPELFPLERTDDGTINELVQLIAAVRELTRFEERNGNPD